MIGEKNMAKKKKEDPYDLCACYEPEEPTPEEFIDPDDREPTWPIPRSTSQTKTASSTTAAEIPRSKSRSILQKRAKPWASFWKI